MCPFFCHACAAPWPYLTAAIGGTPLDYPIFYLFPTEYAGRGMAGDDYIRGYPRGGDPYSLWRIGFGGSSIYTAGYCPERRPAGTCGNYSKPRVGICPGRWCRFAS